MSHLLKTIIGFICMILVGLLGIFLVNEYDKSGCKYIEGFGQIVSCTASSMFE